MNITLARIDDRLIHGQVNHRLVEGGKCPTDYYL